MTAKPGPVSALGTILPVVGVNAAFIAALFVSGEDHYLGRFYIERQAYWNGGTYNANFTSLTVLLTLVAVVIIPMIIIMGLSKLLRNRADDAPSPLDWDTTQLKRRLKSAAFGMIASVVWVAYTGAAVAAPQLLKPAGSLATALLLFMPIVPVLIAVSLFEALVAPRYVEGQLESIQMVNNKNGRAAHLVVAGLSFKTKPASVTGLSQGAKVSLITSGFFNTVLRIEKRG